jgi:Uma2 family endonuclease
MAGIATRPIVTEGEPSPYAGVRMSWEEYLALPLDEIKPYLEYVDGCVIQKAVSSVLHVLIAARMVAELWLYQRRFGGTGGPEPHAHFRDAPFRLVRVPDVVYYAPGRKAADGQRWLAPTLAVEIRSPGQSMRELREKCRMMRRYGTDVCWLIDPERQRAELFEGDRDGAEAASDAVLESAFLPGFALHLAELWSLKA